MHGVKLSHINKSHLYQELFGPCTLKYWNDHHDIPIPTNCDIDWKASQAAAKKLPQGLRCCKAKFASGLIGISSKLKSYKLQDHSTCPLYNAPSEKVSHVLHCTDPQAVKFAKTRIQETLKPKFTEMGTEEAIAESILDIATRHCYNLPIRPDLICTISRRPSERNRKLAGTTGCWEDYLPVGNECNPVTSFP